jgi:hypothetical protein
MKYFFIAAILLCASGVTLAQEDVKAKHAAYFLCIENIENDPHEAYGYCSDYLKKYPNDDKRLTDFAGKFVTAYRKISQYLKSVPMNYFTEKTTGWAVYSPGMLATIPFEDSKGSKYQILIKREYGSPDEEKLLAKTESLYKNPEPVERELLKEWRYIAEPYVLLPDGEPKWWTGPVNTIQSAELVSTGAVLYYYNISQILRSNEGKLNENSFKFVSSNLKYEASIKKMELYERAGKSFSNVYVANMTMTWGEVCGSLCGYGFTRNKIVVMSSSGEILEMFLDDPVNRSSWIS